MADFSRSNDLVQLLRYRGDHLTDYAEVAYPPVAWSRFRSSGIEVLPEVLPQVAEALQAVRSSLELPPESVRGFVYPDADIQANCLAISPSSCGIRLSSALVERFGQSELRFVIGHELGHFLLGPLADGSETRSVEGSQRSRARELSCDRIGLVTCGDVNSAVRAIMKSACGLSDDHLRFDAAAYLRTALAGQDGAIDPARMFASHPPMAIRARALLWFDDFRRQYFPDIQTSEARAHLKKLDGRIAKDMEHYVEGEAEEHRRLLRLDLAQWVNVAAATTNGRFDSGSQGILSTRFGTDFVEKVRNRLLDASVTEVYSWIADNAYRAFIALRDAFPSEAAPHLVGEVEVSERSFLEGHAGNFLRKVGWYPDR